MYKLALSPRNTLLTLSALGALRVLEGIRSAGLQNKTRFYQASTSELYGLVQETPRMRALLLPSVTICGCKNVFLLDHSKLREAYNMYACNDILFNHESPRRGETFC